MEAGRELDKLVADKIMGGVFETFAGHYGMYDAGGRPMEIPAYSADIAAAWQVVEHLRDMWTAATDGVSGFDDTFARPFDDTAFFQSLHRNADRRWPWAFLYVTPYTLCIAALGAVGVEV